MSDSTPSAARQEDPRRQQFLAFAAAAFDLMFAPAYQDQLVTFDQREQRADDLGRDLVGWLLQQHVNADPQARPADEQPAPLCPKCGRPGQRHNPPDQPLSPRPLTTLNGEVTLQRERFRCTTCRVVFFPPGPETPPGH